MNVGDISTEAAGALYLFSGQVSREEIPGIEDGLKSAFQELHQSLAPRCQTISAWTQVGSCQIIAGLGWRVSYKIAKDSNEPETALIDTTCDAFYLLHGDHREAYSRVVSGGWPALFAVYSNLRDEFDLSADQFLRS